MSRVKITELVQRVREAANLQDPVAQAAVEIVRLLVEVTKESLVEADGNDMLRMQGAAKAFSKLHKDLITTPPNIAAAQETTR